MASSLEQFYEKVGTDGDLLKELGELTDEAAFAQRSVELGNQHGFSFTVDDVKARMAAAPPEDAELSDKQMDSVAGGFFSYGNSILCGFCSGGSYAHKLAK